MLKETKHSGNDLLCLNIYFKTTATC